MAKSRLCLLVMVLSCGILQFAVNEARAQSYPSKVVRYIVADPAGGNSDILARVIAEGLTQAFGQQVIVDNRGGAAGNIAAELASKASPDGYTLFQVATTHVVNISLYSHLPYDLVRDFAPVTQLASAPAVVVVHPSMPVKSMKDLVTLAKAQPGAIKYSSAGVGTSTFVAPELFKRFAGIDLLHVPYRGGSQALMAVMTGETSVYFSPVATALPYIQQGRLLALAVTTPKRLALLPDYPTVAESGYPGYQATNWYGLMVPAKTPKEIIANINKAAISTLNNPTWSKRLTDMGFIAVGDQPDEFGAYIKSQMESLGAVMRKYRVTGD